MNSLFATREAGLRTEGKHFRQLHMKSRNLMSTAVRWAKARGTHLTAKPEQWRTLRWLPKAKWSEWKVMAVVIQNNARGGYYGYEQRSGLAE